MLSTCSDLFCHLHLKLDFNFKKLIYSPKMLQVKSKNLPLQLYCTTCSTQHSHHTYTTHCLVEILHHGLNNTDTHLQLKYSTPQNHITDAFLKHKSKAKAHFLHTYFLHPMSSIPTPHIYTDGDKPYTH